MSTRCPRLFAPSVARVELVIDGRDEALAMDRADDGWWTLRDPEQLPDEDFRYRFRLPSKSWWQEGKTVEVVDPETSTPTLEGDWAIARESQAPDYEWQHDEQPLPPQRDLVIYELFVQYFVDHGEGGTFASVGERLDYLAELGITAIELLPVTRGPIGQGRGYTPKFFFAVEPRYGSAEDLARLIDAAHARGMAVLLDVVYNHAHPEVPLTAIDHNLWFNEQPEDPDNAWGPQFNFDHCLPGSDQYPARGFIYRCQEQWIKNFHTDGIRVDAVSQIDDWQFLGEVREHAGAACGVKPFSVIAECLPVDPALVGPEGCMDATWNEPFYHQVCQMLVGAWDGDGLQGAIDCRRQGFLSGSDMVNYLSNHDRGRLLTLLMTAGLDEDAALWRMQLAYTVLLTAAGRPMLWMGDEFGAHGSPGEEDCAPLPWQLLAEDQRRQNLHARIRRLLQLRREHAALREDATDFVHRDDEHRLLAYLRWDGSGGRILVVLHAGDGEAVCHVALQPAGVWHEVTLDYDLASNAEGVLECAIDGWQARVFVYQGG